MKEKEQEEEQVDYQGGQRRVITVVIIFTVSKHVSGNYHILGQL